MEWETSFQNKDKCKKSLSILIDASLKREDGVGELARKLRQKFPKSSLPKIEVELEEKLPFSLL